MKDFIQKNIRLLVFVTALNAGVVVLIVFAFSGYIYYNRASIFNSFASQYLEEEREKNIESESPREQKEILTSEALIIDVVKRANPAVVSIVITKDVPIIEEYFEGFSPFDDFFSPFGGFNFQVPRYREKGTEKKEIGGGSGFFVSSDGLIVTNKHVVSDPKASYSVLTNDGEKFDAEILATDPFFDIAVLKIKNGKTFSHLTFGNSDSLKLGQTVIAIGNALGEFRNSVSVGVISGLSRSIVAGSISGGPELLEEVVQTDAAINPGNSGGPLLDLFGRVIGVNVAVAQGSENIGFALPANLVKGVVESVKQYGEIVRPYVGIRYMQITEAVQKKNKLNVAHGILIIRGETPEDLAIIPGSPADKAGLVENDIILEIDGVKLTSEHSFASLIRKKTVGESVRLTVLHKGEEKEVSIVLERAPKDL